jgi:YidC/Oxa1 family membrane protein insertase
MNFFAEYRLANQLLKEHHPIVFYAESKYYYQYFERLLQDVLQAAGLPVLYITSDEKDPLLTAAPRGLRVVYVKRFLLYLFPKLKAGVVIMTMPDLHTLGFRRSEQVNSYVYVFHAAVSIHQQYREKAFVYYDAVLATHRQHVQELQALQEKHRLPSKDIIPYGYPLLDAIAQKYAAVQKGTAAGLPTILVAPSWFDECIFETCMEELVQYLAPLPYRVVIRSHPEYIKRRPKRYKALQQMVAGKTNMRFDTHANVLDSLIDADLLITDRSGIAIEYALGTLRPVLFIDTPPKIMNIHWKSLGIDPVENTLRSRIGVSLLPEEVVSIERTVKMLTAGAAAYKQPLQQIRTALFYNSEQSYRQGLDYVLAKAVTP